MSEKIQDALLAIERLRVELIRVDALAHERLWDADRMAKALDALLNGEWPQGITKARDALDAYRKAQGKR